MDNILCDNILCERDVKWKKNFKVDYMVFVGLIFFVVGEWGK